MRTRTVLALEQDSAQAEAIRHIVCDSVGAKLTLVISVEEALDALRETTPDVVLLPSPVSAAVERALILCLRSLPHGSSVETLATPMLKAPEQKLVAGPGKWFSWRSRRPAPHEDREEEARLFAQRLVSSLERAKERRSIEMKCKAVSVAESDADATETLPANEVSEKPSDRRTSRRFEAHELPGIRGARIRAGSEVSLVNVSEGGALVTSRSQLRPDSESVLEIVTPEGRLLIPFRVLRCQIAALDGTPRYLGACEFVHPLDLSELVLPVAVVSKVDSRVLSDELDSLLKRRLPALLQQNKDAAAKRLLTDTAKALRKGRERGAGTAGEHAIGELFESVLASVDETADPGLLRRIELHLLHKLPGLEARFAETPAFVADRHAETLYFQVPVYPGRPLCVLNVIVRQGTMLEDWQFRLLKASASLAVLARGVRGENKNKPLSASERRRHPRLYGPFEGRRCGLIDMPILIRDISEGGCFVNSVFDAVVGRKVTIAVDICQTGLMTLTGQVVSNCPPFGFGVRFVDVPAELSDRLAKLIAASSCDLDSDGSQQDSKPDFTPAAATH